MKALLNVLSPEEWTALAGLIAVLTFLGIDRRSGWKAMRWILRRGGPEPETVQKVEVVTPEPQKTGPKFPTILPPPRDRKLVGREKELGRIRSLLASRHGVQITGQTGVALSAEGGRGKTALAKEYAWRFRDAYDGGYWIDAQTRANLLADLARLGERAFDMPVREPVTEADGRAVLGRIADSGARWLLVYDNADSYDEIPGAKQGEVRDLICQAPDVDVIVTSRRALGWDGYGRIDLEVLDTDSPEGGAVDLLLQEAGLAFPSPEDRQAAWPVAQELGGLPLALVLAGALVREDGWSFARLRDEVSAVLTRAPESPDYPDSVAGAVRLTYARLGADAQALADLCAWLAPEGLTEALFAGAVADRKWSAFVDAVLPELRAVLENPDRLRAGFLELRRWSVLSHEGGMHRLTQAVLRTAQMEEGRAFVCARGAAAVLGARFPHKANHVKNWEICRRLLPHVWALWHGAEGAWHGSWERPDWEDAEYLLGQAGFFLSLQRDYIGAVALERPALVLAVRRLGEAHPQIFVRLSNLAKDLSRIGMLAQAWGNITRAVSLAEADGPNIARKHLPNLYILMAGIAMRRMEDGGAIAKGAEAEAETALKKARAILEAQSGPDSADMARFWSQTGQLRSLQSRPDLALSAYGRALEIDRGSKNPDPAQVATCTMNVGMAKLQLGRVEDAWEHFQEAYKLETGFFEACNPSLVMTVGCLVACLFVRERKGDGGARREAEALCARYGLDLTEREAFAATLPLEPVVEG